MSFKKTLRTIVLATVIGFSGCDVKVEKETENALFKDLNSDGKLDMVYCIKKRFTPEYRVYVRYNIGEEKFGKPQMLLETDRALEDAPILKYVNSWDELSEEYKQ